MELSLGEKRFDNGRALEYATPIFATGFTPVVQRLLHHFLVQIMEQEPDANAFRLITL
jgi:hypothetical protein